MANLNWDDNYPRSDEYNDFYKGYIQLVDSDNVPEALIQQGKKIYNLLQQLGTDKADFRYAENKWSIKQVFGHLLDTNRIMAYRALCISRGEEKALPGYGQDEYVKNAQFPDRSLNSLATEYDALRNANVSLFNSFSQEQAVQKGNANGEMVSVRALVYIIAGHERHHLTILKEKYGLNI